ncbi:MAG: DUF3365 domain-containing protein [Marinoscillum sp.]
MTLKNILFTISLLLIGATFSCRPDKPVDREAVKQEMESRELKRVSEVDLMAKGDQIGRESLEVIESTFQTQLKTAVAKEGIAGAISFCNLNAMDIVKKLEDSLGISIKRVTDKPRNPADSLSGIEKEIWEAYAYSPQNGSAQIQELNKTALIYTKPIMINTGLCLSCHGEVDQEITKENHSLIQQLYPDDMAIGYKVGDLRGMWRLIIPKKVAVDQL